MDHTTNMYLCIVNGDKVDETMLGMLDQERCQFFSKRVVGMFIQCTESYMVIAGRSWGH
jgi:hypothetical protein